MGAWSGLDHKHNATVSDFWFSFNEVWSIQNEDRTGSQHSCKSSMLEHGVVFSSDLPQGTGLCVGSWSEFGRKKVYQNVNQIKVK